MRGLSCAAIDCACSSAPPLREIGGDPGRAKRVIADRRDDAGRGGAPADHAPGVRPALIGCSVSTVALCRGLVRNSQPLRSSAMPAASM